MAELAPNEQTDDTQERGQFYPYGMTGSVVLAEMENTVVDNIGVSPSPSMASLPTPKEGRSVTGSTANEDCLWNVGVLQMQPQFESEAKHNAAMPTNDNEGCTELSMNIPSGTPDYSRIHNWIENDSFSVESSDPYENEAAQMGGELSISAINEKYNERLGKARHFSYVGFVISLIQGSVAMGLGISNSMISLTAMGAQICIDLVSSLFVVWRFYSRTTTTRLNPRHADTEYRLREALREKRAALGVGLLLLITSLWASSWGFVKVFGVPASPDERIKRALVALSVAWPGVFLFTCISAVKWNFALKLKSRVLQKDAVCTSFGAAVSFVTALFATIDYSVSEKGRYPGNTGAADSVAALIMAALLMVEGIRTIYQNTIGWIPPSGVTKETVDQYYLTRKGCSDQKQ